MEEKHRAVLIQWIGRVEPDLAGLTFEKYATPDLKVLLLVMMQDKYAALPEELKQIYEMD